MKISSHNRYAWLEESFVFSKPSPKQVASPTTDAYLGHGLSPLKIRWLRLVVFMILSLLIGRVAYLQIGQHSTYAKLAEGNRERLVPILAERGLLFDRHGVQLTINVPNFALALVPQDLPRRGEKRDQVISRLAELTKRDELDIRHILEEYGSYSYESIIIQENLDYETALLVQIAAADLPGIHIQRGSKRLYTIVTSDETPDMLSTSTTIKSLSHLIGYEGKLSREELDRLYQEGYLPSDNIGKVGVEKSYESYLRGSYGRRRIEVNALGQEQSALSEQQPMPGHHLRLSIDAIMQAALESFLQKALAVNHKTRGTAIAMDPRNGEILSLVSLPTFDNNDFAGGIDKITYEKYVNDPNGPLFNRAIAGTYPSGSSIKPAIAVAALQAGIINSHTSFVSAGGITVGSWFFPDWLPGGHGATDVRKAIAWSVNTFFYYIGGGKGEIVGLGVEQLTEFLRRFGFASQLGIDLPGEDEGFLPSPAWKETIKKEQWYIGDTYNLSIGQGDLLVTPLQIAAMTSVIANGGTLYAPRVGQALIHPVTKREIPPKPQVLREQVVAEKHLATVRLGMRDCVIYGSCRQLFNLPVAVAGKTGTAQWSTTRDPHAWFTSFAPYDNPEIVLTILIEEGGEGSAVAVPVAKEFYHWWWAYQAVDKHT